MYTSIYEEQVAEVQARFVTKVFGWMSLALAITAVVSMFVASTPALIQDIFSNRLLFWGLIIAEFGIVFWLSGFINKMSAATATAAFIGYSVLNGLTLSVIFLVYTQAAIASAFAITCGTFGAMSLYGYFTKTDLTKIGNICFMALIGVIIASLVNIFWANSTLYWIINYVGVLVFVGLTAYDTQKIKQLSLGAGDAESSRKLAIIGALNLYLDFINLFLFILRILGGNRD
jgi:FtsH-binding integral membrane protein